MDQILSNNPLILTILVLLLVYEFIYQNLLRQHQRSTYYQLALKRSKQLKKPLLVIGDPHNGIGSRFWGQKYGCGDICLDLTGCPKCPNGVQQDGLAYLKNLPFNSHVIFISCVLEYVDHPDQWIYHLHRVSGQPQNLFVVKVEPKSLSAYFYTDGHDTSKNVILDAPPTNNRITYQSLDNNISQ